MTSKNRKNRSVPGRCPFVVAVFAVAAAQGSTRLDVNALLGSGAASVVHTPLDIGTVEHAFDGTELPILRTANINPLMINLTFGEPQTFDGFRSWFQGGSNRWKVEAADSLADLDGMSGTYALLADWVTGPDNAWSSSILPAPHTCRVLRYTQNRLTGDNYVHLGEWELLQPERDFAILSVEAGEGAIDLTWTAEPNQWYAVERAAELGGWSEIDYVKGGGNTASWRDSSPPDERRLFYRVARTAPENRPFITKKVLVLNYDPILESKGGKRVHEYFRWLDPRWLTDQLLADLTEASGDYVRWEIVDFVDIDEFPLKADGFRYTDQSYLDAWATGNFHDPDGVNYVRVIEDHDLDRRVREGEVDEVVMWGGPYFGYWESQMVGPTAYWCNSGGLYRPNTRLYIIMGLNYERGVAEELESFGHRTESIMWHVYGSWSGGSTINHLWDRFTKYDKAAPGLAACGNVHYPPNGQADYDYGNSLFVMSEAGDWLNFPNFTGAKRSINASEWGWSHRGYLKWWYGHMPKVPGRHTDGKASNWWSYIVDFNEYPESR